jgi:hypothetical protein
MSRPRIHTGNADRQRAYRARKKGNSMTTEERLGKLKEYVKEMARQFNELEKRVEKLEREAVTAVARGAVPFQFPPPEGQQWDEQWDDATKTLVALNNKGLCIDCNRPITRGQRFKKVNDWGYWRHFDPNCKAAKK